MGKLICLKVLFNFLCSFECNVFCLIKEVICCFNIGFVRKLW